MPGSLTRRQFLRTTVAATAATVVAGCGAGESGPSPTPTERVDLDFSLPAPTGRAKASLERLLAGNARFVAGRPRHPEQSRARVLEVAKEQHPHAIVLSCADSRVPPELLFDEGIGDLFVDRVAGNIPDEATLGSVEYGVEHLDIPLVLVLGHERCGAVTASVEAVASGTEPDNHERTLIHAISPVVAAVRNRDRATTSRATTSGTTASGATTEELVDRVVSANARWTAHQLIARSDLIGDRHRNAGLGVVAARYDLDTGTVTVLT